MADKDAWVVKVPLAQLKGPDGSYSHHYEGAPVPDLADGLREQLHDEGIIGPADQEFKFDEKKPLGESKPLGKWETVEQKQAPADDLTRAVAKAQESEAPRRTATTTK